jgi:hypothetical protein
MLSPLAGGRVLPVQVSGGSTVTVKGGDGNNPANTRFRTLEAVAARGERSVEVVLLNRSYDTPEKAWLEIAGVSPKRARVERLGPADPKAGNDEKADTVMPVASEVPVGEFSIVELPPRSLARISYSLP